MKTSTFSISFEKLVNVYVKLQNEKNKLVFILNLVNINDKHHAVDLETLFSITE